MLGLCVQAIICLGTRATLPVSFVSKWFWFLQICPVAQPVSRISWNVTSTWLTILGKTHIKRSLVQTHITNVNVCTIDIQIITCILLVCKPSTCTKHRSSSFSTVEVRHSIGAMDKFRHLQRMVIGLSLPR